ETAADGDNEPTLGNRLHTHQCRTAGGADDSGFGDRRTNDAANAEMVAASLDELEGPGTAAHVCADNENGLIAGQVFPDAVTDSLDHCDGLCLLLRCGG